MDTLKPITNENIVAILDRIHPRVYPENQPIADELCLKKDLGFDSLDVLEATVMLDEAFGVTTPIDAAIPFTIGELRVFIEGLRNDQT
jgi:acyl carrier protein